MTLIISVSEDMEKPETPYTDGRNIKWYRCRGKLSAISSNAKIESLFDLEILILGIYIREKKTCSHKNMYTKVHGSVIHHNQKVETTQTSVIDEQSNR